MKALSIFFLSFWILMLLSCAAIQSPSGGPKDVTPPEIIKTMPPNGSVNIKNKKTIYVDLLYILFVGCYTLPFVLAWSTSKHLVPIIIVSYFYILHQIFKNNIKLLLFNKLGSNINQSE